MATHTMAATKTAPTLTWPALRGAVAYNVYIAATHGGVLYYAFTTTATKVTIVTAAGLATFLATPATYTAASYGTPTVLATLPIAPAGVPNTSDQTADALAFDGLIPQIEVNANSLFVDSTVQYNGGGYFKDLSGATYTSDGGNGIVELDTMLKSLWDTSRIGPTRIYVNSQEAESWGKLIVQAGAGVGTYRWTQQVNADGSVTGGLVADSYRNKFTSPRIIPIEIHPYLAPGTVLALSERPAVPPRERPVGLPARGPARVHPVRVGAGPAALGVRHLRPRVPEGLLPGRLRRDRRQHRQLSVNGAGRHLPSGPTSRG